MKNIFIVFFALSALFLASCSGNSKKSEDSAAKTEKVSDTKLVKVEMKVQGMTCTGCENTVKSKLGAIAGVENVTASHVDGIVTLDIPEGEVSREDIKKAIAAAGYSVGE